MDNMGAQPVYDVNNNNDGLGFGGGWIWILFIAFIFLWGGNGAWGQNRGPSPATTQDVSNGFSFNSLSNDLRALERGQCSAGYENAQLINGINNNMQAGFNSINNGICDLGYRNQQCCCETNRNIDSVRYEASKNTCDIITAANANTQRIIDTMNANEVQKLRDELSEARLRISNQEQTTALIYALRPTPIPAYVTCSPYESNQIASGLYGRCGCYNNA